MSKNATVDEFMHKHIKNLGHIESVGLEDTESRSQLSKAIVV